MVFVGVIEKDGEQTASIYNGFEQWHKDTFCPDVKIVDVLPLVLDIENYQFYSTKPGKISDYTKKQTLLRDKAYQWQNIFADNSLSYGEIATVCGWFETQAKRYGLLKEFKANAIC